MMSKEFIEIFRDHKMQPQGPDKTSASRRASFFWGNSLQCFQLWKEYDFNFSKVPNPFEMFLLNNF